jgi:hypothetical protein
MDTEENFNDQVDRWMVDAVEGGRATFDRLLTSLPGVYPPVVFESLRRLASKGLLPNGVFRDAESYIRRERPHELRKDLPARRITLPVPHPLDYDWRFTDEAADRILTATATVTRSGGILAMIGSPSVFRVAAERASRPPLAVIDRSRAITDSLNAGLPDALVECLDVTRDELPDIEASSVIVDPPWYEEHFRAFAWAACRISRLGSSIFFSLPPAGTRPGIVAEITRFVEWSQSELGLDLLRIDTGVLPYVTPPFERNALRAEGFNNLPDDWRKGDLAAFVRRRRVTAARPVLTGFSSFDDGKWEEVTVQGMRVRVKNGMGDNSFPPKLVSIVAGDVLPTVSRRDERRKKAEVWTSGNRVFASHGKPSLLNLLSTLATGEAPENSLVTYLGRGLQTEEAALISDMTRRILELARIESVEYSHASGGNL